MQQHALPELFYTGVRVCCNTGVSYISTISITALKESEGIPDEKLARLVEQCFHQHMEGLHRYAWTILRNNEAARDAVQAVFLKLWEKRTTIDEQQSVQSWLYTSVYNYCLNVKRSDAVRSRYATEQQMQHSASSYTDHLLSKEQQQQIREALNSLPPQCKLIFHKSRFEQMKYAAIAEELGISVKTVEAQIGKALRILREKLSQVLVILLLYLTQ